MEEKRESDFASSVHRLDKDSQFKRWLAEEAVRRKPRENQMARERDKRLLVAAIDFGTTYSGYAFSFVHDQTGGEANAEKIYMNMWHHEGGSQTNIKAPSCLLLQPNGNLHSFGNTALEKYKELTENGDHHHWYFFWQFKMALHQEEEIHAGMLLQEVCGKSLKALDVFRYSIQFIKEHLLGEVRKQVQDLTESDVSWVITVPAIWKDSAKKFMRQAAVQAGIKADQLEVALEPEAASLYCRNMKSRRMIKKGGLTDFPVGTVYMVLDCGGGTVDVTVHEVVHENKLKELHAATGGDWGGTKVNKAFCGLIKQLMGPENFQSFSSEYNSDYLQLLEDFEKKKCSVNPDATGTMSLRIPSTLSRFLQTHQCHSLMAAKNLSLVGDKLRIDADLFLSLFNEAVRDIIDHIERLVENIQPRIEILLLVGGFAESLILQRAVDDRFRERYKIIIPLDASLCVLKGAVMYGFSPKAVASRRCRYTYGVAVSVRFDERVHPPQRRSDGSGEAFCDDVFDKHVEMNQEVPSGEVVSKKVYYPIGNERFVHFSLYRSSKKNPRFVNERGCHRVGTVEMKIDTSIGQTSRDRPITASMIFGSSDIKILGQQKNGGPPREMTFKLNGEI